MIAVHGLEEVFHQSSLKTGISNSVESLEILQEEMSEKNAVLWSLRNQKVIVTLWNGQKDQLSMKSSKWAEITMHSMAITLEHGK